mmetsp:Transcript_58625/g.71705  ORF Transcript_58625/g.71705 Transcript_58625/m.71705 type:complete len:111 (+) Transcript_58625:357-689(+)
MHAQDIIHQTSDIDKKTEGYNLINIIRQERTQLRTKMKESYNKRFGSVFRTHSTRTLFFHKMAKYSDLYCNEVTCMYDHDINHNFNSRRIWYDHEPEFSTVNQELEDLLL